MSPASLQCSLQYLPKGPLSGTEHEQPGWAHFWGAMAPPFLTVPSSRVPRAPTTPFRARTVAIATRLNREPGPPFEASDRARLAFGDRRRYALARAETVSRGSERDHDPRAARRRGRRQRAARAIEGGEFGVDRHHDGLGRGRRGRGLRRGPDQRRALE